MTAEAADNFEEILPGRDPRAGLHTGGKISEVGTTERVDG